MNALYDMQKFVEKFYYRVGKFTLITQDIGV